MKPTGTGMPKLAFGIFGLWSGPGDFYKIILECPSGTGFFGALFELRRAFGLLTRIAECETEIRFAISALPQLFNARSQRRQLDVALTKPRSWKNQMSLRCVRHTNDL